MRRCQRARVGEKRRQRGERRRVANVVDEHGAGRAAVVGARDGAEALCAGGVPELQLEAFPARAVADFDDLAGELDADGLRGEDAPFVFYEAVEEAGSWKFSAVGAVNGLETHTFRIQKGRAGLFWPGSRTCCRVPVLLALELLRQMVSCLLGGCLCRFGGRDIAAFALARHLVLNSYVVIVA